MAELTPNNSYTSGQLILGALKLMGIEEAGETSTDEDMTDGLFFLNLLLDEWSVDRDKIFARVEDIKTLTVGTGSYTFGPGGDIDSQAPIRIEQAFLRNTTFSPALDYIVDTDMLQQEYNEIPIKNIQTIPTKLFYLKEFPLGTIYLNYLPNLAYEMHLFSWKALGRIADINTQLLMPDGYEAALTYNLAVAFAPAFGKKVPDHVAIRAERLARAISNKDYEVPRVKLRGIPGTIGRAAGSIYNPFTRS